MDISIFDTFYDVFTIILCDVINGYPFQTKLIETTCSIKIFLISWGSSISADCGQAAYEVGSEPGLPSANK